MSNRLLSPASLLVVTIVACHNISGAPPIPDGLRFVPRTAWGAHAPVLPMTRHVPNRLTIHHTATVQNHSRTIEQKMSGLQQPTDLIAGRAFNPIISDRLPRSEAIRVDDRTTEAEYAALAARADSADLLLVSAYVSPREFAGTVGAQGGFTQFVEKFALSGKPIIVLSFGSPYLLSAFPSVSSYLLAWGGSPVSQRAAALAVLGDREINGRLPISLPPALPFGAGIHRAQTRISSQ